MQARVDTWRMAPHTHPVSFLLEHNLNHSYELCVDMFGSTSFRLHLLVIVNLVTRSSIVVFPSVYQCVTPARTVCSTSILIGVWKKKRRDIESICAA